MCMPEMKPGQPKHYMQAQYNSATLHNGSHTEGVAEVLIFFRPLESKMIQWGDDGSHTEGVAEVLIFLRPVTSRMIQMR